jgi:hypothetical protein
MQSLTVNYYVKKGTDLFSSILSWSALLPVFNPPPNDYFYFIAKSLGSSQLLPLQRLTDQLPLTHPPVSYFARIPCSASPVHRHNSPAPQNTGRYPAHRIDSPFQPATDNWTRDTPPDRRSCGHEPDLTPHIGNTPTNRRLSLSDWADSGLPKASPFWIPADSPVFYLNATEKINLSPFYAVLSPFCGPNCRFFNLQAL